MLYILLQIFLSFDSRERERYIKISGTKRQLICVPKVLRPPARPISWHFVSLYLIIPLLFLLLLWTITGESVSLTHPLICFDKLFYNSILPIFPIITILNNVSVPSLAQLPLIYRLSNDIGICRANEHTGYKKNIFTLP